MPFIGKRENTVLSWGTKVQFSDTGLVRTDGPLDSVSLGTQRVTGWSFLNII